MPPTVVVLVVVAAIASLAGLALFAVRGGSLASRVLAGALVVGLAAATMTVLLDRSRPASEVRGSPTISARATDPSASSTPTDRSPATAASPTLIRYEAAVTAGAYTVFKVDSDGTLTGQRAVKFDGPSRAPVDRVEAADGLVHWRTVVGALAGFSYVPDRSGSFQIREVLRWPDGRTEFRPIEIDS